MGSVILASHLRYRLSINRLPTSACSKVHHTCSHCAPMFCVALLAFCICLGRLFWCLICSVTRADFSKHVHTARCSEGLFTNCLCLYIDVSRLSSYWEVLVHTLVKPALRNPSDKVTFFCFLQNFISK